MPRRRPPWFATLLVVWLAVQASLPGHGEAAPTQGTDLGPPPPTVELYTMGPGDDVFSLFGHAALCVIAADDPDGVCYNYGTADFSRPVALGWEVLRNRGRFFVSASTVAAVIASYRAVDRTIYRQTLPLAPAAARALARRLAFDALPENRAYVYHHFLDNCATRLRDQIDTVTGGALHAGADVALGPTWRELVNRGLVGRPGLLVLSDLVLGWRVDRRLTVWQGMFLPDVLRAEVTRRLDAPAEIVYERQRPLPEGSPAAAGRTLLVIGLVLAAVGLGGAARRRGWARRTAAVVVAIALFLLAAIVDVSALVSNLIELRANAQLLVLLPTDLALIWLGGRRLRLYLGARLVLLAAVGAAAAAGLLVQPVGPSIALCAAALVPPYLAELRAVRSEARSHPPAGT